ncbi:MAG: hypothetical protein P4L03_06035 [Terracidiphilus sp.]|nr:hypothetical protein [Terracidiphilus sp.]
MESRKEPATEKQEMESLPLGECLHDARLERVASSPDERVVVFEFDIRYLRTFFCLPEETRFLLKCMNADLARLSEEVPWPETPYQPGPSERQDGSAADWQAVWETAAIEWPELERRLAAEPTGPAEVLEAVAEKHMDGRWALRMGLHVNDAYYPGLYVRCSEVQVSRSDGEPLPFEQFLQMGEDYWEDFADRRRYLKESMLPR